VRCQMYTQVLHYDISVNSWVRQSENQVRMFPWHTTHDIHLSEPSPKLRSDHSLTVLSLLALMNEFSLSSTWMALTLLVCPVNDMSTVTMTSQPDYSTWQLSTKTFLSFHLSTYFFNLCMFPSGIETLPYNSTKLNFTPEP